jgi:UPF0755 protein
MDTIFGMGIILFLVFCIGFYSFSVWIRTEDTYTYSNISNISNVEMPQKENVIQFPVSVDPHNKEIFESSVANDFFNEHYAMENVLGKRARWFNKIIGKLALSHWYQNLASASTRILVIQSGERKEEIAENFKSILNWDTTERDTFVSLVSEPTPTLKEGKFYPGKYIVQYKASPEEVAELVRARFSDEVLERYGEKVSTLVSLDQAIIIASLLEREAYDFADMRHISGVIWNRLFTDMRLQLDATLQYAKGSSMTQSSWWPKVVPADKYIASVYNTYKYNGVPPGAIANPSAEAILAALNPTKADCMYYFHDADGGFHCTKTYEDHRALIKKYYGRGK